MTAMKVANDPHLLPYPLYRMMDHGDGKKSDTYGPPCSRHHVNQGLKQQQKQQQHLIPYSLFK